MPKSLRSLLLSGIMFVGCPAIADVVAADKEAFLTAYREYQEAEKYLLALMKMFDERFVRKLRSGSKNRREDRF